MTPRGKSKPSGPDLGGLTDDWDRLQMMRQDEHAQGAAQPEAPADPAPPDPPKKERKRAAPTEKKAAAGTGDEPRMTRRSWYATTSSVTALAEAVDDIHHATRVPKHEIVSKLFEAAADAAPQVRKKLSA